MATYDRIKQLLAERKYCEAVLLAGYTTRVDATVDSLVKGVGKCKYFNMLDPAGRKAVLNILGIAHLLLLHLEKAASFFIQSGNYLALKRVMSIALRHGRFDVLFKLKNQPGCEIPEDEYKSFLREKALPLLLVTRNNSGFCVDEDVVNRIAGELGEDKSRLLEDTIRLMEEKGSRNLPRKYALSQMSGNPKLVSECEVRLKSMDGGRRKIDTILEAYCRAKGMRLVKKLQDGDRDDFFPLVSHIYLVDEKGSSLVLKENLRLFSDFSRLDGYTVEREVLEKVKHPHVVGYKGYFTVHGIEFLRLEYLDGENLERYSSSKSLPQEEACKIVKAIAEVLDYLLVNGIIYMDVKDKNVLYGKEIKLFDFGRAQFIQAGLSLDKAFIPSLLSTPEYVPPEMGENFICYPRSDVFSLGLLWCRLLTLKNPFQNCDFAEGDEHRESSLIKFALPAMLLEPNLTDRVFVENPKLSRFIKAMLDKDHTKRPWPAEVAKFVERKEFL
ncbi:MAG: protein kinase [archaeon]